MNRQHSGDHGPRGFFGIGIWHGKCGDNVGTLWRSAFQLGASFIYTIGRRYPRQSSDTVRRTGTSSYNVAMAGTLVMYDRMAKQLERAQ